MKKMSTLFKVNHVGKNHTDITREIRLENEWVFTEPLVKATRKFDGTSCMILDGQLFRRYDAKRGKPVPEGAIVCGLPDEITGHNPCWIKCETNKPGDKYHFEAFNLKEVWEDGTYELCGEKVQGNPEKITGHKLIIHGVEVLNIKDWTFEGFKEFLETPLNDIEGIVFHSNIDGKMCKLRKCDFNIKRNI